MVDNESLDDSYAEFKYEGPIQQMAMHERVHVPTFAGIYAGERAQENPHLRKSAQKFRHGIFSKIRQLVDTPSQSNLDE